MPTKEIEYYDTDPQSDPDEQNRGYGWYWWDETWSISTGPYATEALALAACQKYCDEELG